jgi:hypothetical protein
VNTDRPLSTAVLGLIKDVVVPEQRYKAVLWDGSREAFDAICHLTGQHLTYTPPTLKIFLAHGYTETMQLGWSVYMPDLYPTRVCIASNFITDNWTWLDD